MIGFRTPQEKLVRRLTGKPVFVGEAGRTAPDSRGTPRVVIDAAAVDETLVVVLDDGAVVTRGGSIRGRTVSNAARIVWTGASAPGRVGPFRGLVAVAEPGGITFHAPPPVRTTGGGPTAHPVDAPTGLLGADVTDPIDGRISQLRGDSRSLVLMTEDDTVIGLFGPVTVADASDSILAVTCRAPVVVDRPVTGTELLEVDRLRLRARS